MHIDSVLPQGARISVPLPTVGDIANETLLGLEEREGGEKEETECEVDPYLCKG